MRLAFLPTGQDIIDQFREEAGTLRENKTRCNFVAPLQCIYVAGDYGDRQEYCGCHYQGAYWPHFKPKDYTLQEVWGWDRCYFDRKGKRSYTT